MKLRVHRNRSLYDVGTKKYVKLVDVGRAIRAGETLTVTSSADDRDCTSVVLLQLLYDDALSGVAFPLEPLLALIRAERPRKKSAALEALQAKLGGAAKP